MKIENYNSEKIEVQAEQQQKKEVKLIGQQRKVPGLILWEYNKITGEIKPAEYKKVNLHLESISLKSEDIKINHRVDVRENCIYIQALNKKNAEKKIKKRL